MMNVEMKQIACQDFISLLQLSSNPLFIQHHFFQVSANGDVQLSLLSCAPLPSGTLTEKLKKKRLCFLMTCSNTKINRLQGTKTQNTSSGIDCTH